MTRLKEIKERCEKATPGPWKPYEDCPIEHRLPNYSANKLHMEDPSTDLPFVLHAREDIPWLVSQLEKAIEMAQLYAGHDFDWGYDHALDGICDYGSSAREFLEGLAPRLFTAEDLLENAKQIEALFPPKSKQ